jgi:hypothetical protein
MKPRTIGQENLIHHQEWQINFSWKYSLDSKPRGLFVFRKHLDLDLNILVKNNNWPTLVMTILDN